MAWITTKDGRRVDTEWFDADERTKYEQIEQNAKQAADLNKRNQGKQPASVADVYAKLAKLDMTTFSGKMQAINTLMGAGIKELNKSDVKDIFGNREQLKDELEYLGCRVSKVADLFNVKMPDTKFTREELQRQKQLERSTKGLF